MLSKMEDLQISGRSSVASSRPKPKPKTLGVNFSQRRREKPGQEKNSKVVNLSKESRASTTYLNSPSGADKVGNPLLNSNDILDRLSRSLPPSSVNSNLEPEEVPVKDSVVMKPDFAARNETHDSAAPAHAPVDLTPADYDAAATKIQRQWRKRKEENVKADTPEDLDQNNTFKMSEELRELLDQERKKMLADREKESTAKVKSKVDVEKKKREARLKAIEELNKKRDEKRRLQQQILQEELQLNSEVIKVKRKNVKRAVTPKKQNRKEVSFERQSAKKEQKTDTSSKESKKDIVPSAQSPQKEDQKNPGTKVEDGTETTVDTTYDNLVDEIFLPQSRRVRTAIDSDIDTPRVGWEPETESTSESPAKRETKPEESDCVSKGSGTIREEKKVFASLLETLKMLEVESEEALSEVKSSSIIIPPTPKLTQGEVYRLGASELHTGGVMPSGKIKSLLHFLDHVDQVDTQEHVDTTSLFSGVDSVTSAAALVEQQRMKNVSAVVDEVTENIKDTQKQLNSKGEQIELLKSELSTTSNKTAQLQAQIFATKLESDEKSKAVAMLRRALDEQRDLTLRLTNEQEKDAQQRLANQKTEYETTIQRHLGFIDQLIADKKDLSDKVENLMTQMRSTEKKLGDKIKLLEDNQKVEVKKQREAIEAAEKIKRERWIAEKSNKIKEMTVKGLEPEIQKLIAKNKAEIKRLNAVHEAELLAADERASKRFVAQVEDLRKQLDEEKEAACARERDNAQKRFEKQVEQEENAYQQQRRRLYTEVQEEKERAAELLTKERARLGEDRQKIEEEFNTKAAKVQAQHTLEIERIQRDHENTLRDVKLRIQVEKEQWLENQKQKQAVDLMAKERQIRENLRIERNKEIEVVISKLEEQAALQKEESQATLDCRIKRLKDKYESQISDIEHLNNTTQSKLNVMKERVTDLEADNIRLRGHIKSVERQNEDLEKFSGRLKGERDKVEEVIRGEFSERLVTLEEDNKNLKSELVECKTRHKLEVERQKRLHEDEMTEVQNRIKSAFAKRDELIKELKDKSSAASARADHLEALLIKQREQLLKPVPK
ncbi:hypothetical protein ACHWQZ_G009330 [Mnemiopsis leidyi]